MKNNLIPEIEAITFMAGKRSVAFRPPNLTGAALKDLIRAMPGKFLLLGVVYVEDIYETRFGDGFYSYAERAFFSIEAAEKCAAWLTAETTKEPHHPGYRGRVRLEKVEMDGDGNLLDVHENSLLARLNGNDGSWVLTVDTSMGKEGVEPDFGDVTPTVEAITSVNPALSLQLTDPVTGSVRSVELVPDCTLCGTLNELVDEGLASPLRAALAALPPDLPGPARNLSSFVLLLLDCNTGAYTEAADRGLAMNAAGIMPKAGQLHVALALNYAGRPDEAYDILAKADRPKGDYQLACCASRIANYEVALGHLIRAVEIDPAVSVSRIPIDVDFAPMWEHFINGAATIGECVMLHSPLLDVCWAEIAGFDKPCSYLDHFDYARLPARLRPAVKANVGLFVYRARVAGDPRYDVNLASELAEFLARDAAERLATSQAAVSAAAIPLKMLLAANALAESGDIMHARWGLLHLAKDYPKTVLDFGSFCKNLQLRVVATELAAVEAARPGFIADFGSAFLSRDGVAMLEILKTLPGRVQCLGTIQMGHGHYACAIGDNEGAVAAYLAAAHCWPNDPAPFHNAAQALAELGRWEEAAAVITGAPAAFHEIEQGRKLASAIEARSF